MTVKMDVYIALGVRCDCQDGALGVSCDCQDGALDMSCDCQDGCVHSSGFALRVSRWMYA